MAAVDVVAILLNGDRDYGFLGREFSGAMGEKTGRLYYIICADGGLGILRELNERFGLGLRADLLVGDMDSLPMPESRIPSLVKEVKRKPAQDRTDGEFALDEAVKLKPGEIIIYGGLGGRHDHEHANIAVLERFLPTGIDIKLVDHEKEVFLLGRTSRPAELHGKRGQVVSLLPITRKVEVELEGFKWKPVNGTLYRYKSTGVSNVTTKKTAKIKVKTGVLKVVRFEL